MTRTKLERFKDLLAELFMFDAADLDFGIYRIMNAKRDEITKFLNTDLLPQVRENLAELQTGGRIALEKQLKEAVQQAHGLGVDPESTARVKELRAQLSGHADLEALENEVFSDLYNFFRRYYKEGDFLSLPRYKEGVYAIPYEGEEVKLHWANHDQYYIKTSEYFRDYTFKLDDGRRVHFKIVEADTEQDNKKEAAGKERRFILARDNAIVEKNGELIISFIYAVDPEKRKQADLNKQAGEAVFLDSGVKAWIAALKKPEPTDKDTNRTLLHKRLTDYTARNTFDYFIHKNLGKFLHRELDFYIKNEVMHLDDIENETSLRVDQYISKIKAIRGIAHKIIDFLAQLENFQKKLWLKKKFVIETNYCITLDQIPEEFYPEIAANENQRKEWVALDAIDEIQGDLANPGYSQPLTSEFLKSNRMLLLDTRNFPPEFCSRLLKTIRELDEQIRGIVIKSENHQGLSYCKSLLRNGIRCIYIDPPYNAESSEILYKNTYKDSSWLSLMENRLSICGSLLAEDSVLIAAIDDVEQEVLGRLLSQIFSYHTKTCVTIVHNATGQQGTNFSYTHEYAYFVFPAEGKHIGLQNRKDNPDIRPLRNVSKGSHLRTDAANCFYPILISDGRIIGFGEVCPDEYHPEGINQKRSDGIIEVYPIDLQGIERKWVFARDTVESIIHELRPEYDKEKGIWDIIRTKERFNYKTVWWDSRYSANSYGSRLLNEMLPGNTFTFPKSINTVRDCVDAGLNNENKGWILDFFAGSGTTGHAVINLNREDGGTRRFVLIEMGDHFDTVLVPRLKKAIYSTEWRAGKPTRLLTKEEMAHSPKMLKILRLESYEDALNNLHLQRGKPQGELIANQPELREDYMLRYMLDVESEGSKSLLNVDHFAEPFSYTMRISSGTAGESDERPVDLVETFNYLLGLRVKHMDAIRGFKIVEGMDPKGEKVLVIWRNTKEKSNADLDEFFQKQGYNTKDNEYDLVYVNGDNNLENLRREDETWKVRLIEEDFKRLMFDVEEM